MEKTVQKLSERLKKKTPYQLIADKYGVEPDYVGAIARGTRKGKRGKAALIKIDLEKMANGEAINFDKIV